jgi:hypothetical protein
VKHYLSLFFKNIFKILNHYILAALVALYVIHTLHCLQCPLRVKLKIASAEVLMWLVTSQGGKDGKVYACVIVAKEAKFELLLAIAEYLKEQNSELFQVLSARPMLLVLYISHVLRTTVICFKSYYRSVDIDLLYSVSVIVLY